MKKKIHLIGIGGIGVSALAQYYLSKGWEVSGSDLVCSEITDGLKKKGVKLTNQVPKQTDIVIYSPAVQPDNPQYKEAKTRKIKTLSYPQALGELTKWYFTIAVSGTHGKSTTCAMISLILEKAGLDPTVIIGTKLKEFGNSNFRPGKSPYLIIEADEWNFSFLNYWPKIIVLTNIEREHLDCYKDLRHILKTYKEYIGHLDKNGLLIINGEDKNIKRITNKELRIKTCSLKQKGAKKLKEILKVPGKHNIYNALAALTTARALTIPDKVSFEALSGYVGSWRRFEQRQIKIGKKKLNIIHDYAHHPTEIKATLLAVKEKFPNKKIWCVFQPHQYQRTFYLFKDFIKVLSEVKIDKMIVTDIYDVVGREKKKIKKEIDSKKLVQKINRPWVEYLPKKEIKKYLAENSQNNQITIIMGAGDIYNAV